MHAWIYKRFALAALLMAALLALAAIALLGGCGSQADSGSTVEAGATAESQPLPSLSSADLPMDADARLVFNTNLPGSLAPVDFTVDGPWDFSDGPGGTTLTVNFTDADSAPGHEDFPDATVATTYTWGSGVAAQAALPAAASASEYRLPSSSGSAGLGQSSQRSTTSRISPAPAGSYTGQSTITAQQGDSSSTQTSAAAQYTASAAQYAASSSFTGLTSEYNFESMDTDSWKAFGAVGPAGLVSYSHPSQALIFPATVGDEWSDSFTRQQNGQDTAITESNRIVAYNKLTVPAGTFDAFLLRTRIEANDGHVTTATIDYLWLVPGVGRAAEIISQPGEQNDIFTKAYAFYRLRDY